MSIKVTANGAINLFVRRYAGPFWYRRQWLNRTQWLSKEELTDIQLKLLKRIIRYVESHVPYYQKLMKNIRQAIESNSFDSFRKQFLEKYFNRA